VLEDQLTAIFFGKGLAANPEAEVLKSLLASAGIESLIRWTPPTFQHRDGISLLVVESQREDAVRIIEQAQMGQGEEVSEEHPTGKFVTVFSSNAHDAESEADTIHSLLDSAGLQSVIVRENVQELPTGGVEVRVLPQEADEARDLIEQALETGFSADEEE
jgi:nitrate reductase NapAB chaperone NapD